MDMDPDPPSPGRAVQTCSSYSFGLDLECSKTGETTRKTITLGAYPGSVVQLKQEIQRAFSIPGFAQTVLYESAVLKDADELNALHIRSGDTLRVVFESVAECVEVEKVLEWLTLLARAFESHVPTVGDHESCDGIVVLAQGISQGRLRSLATEIFQPYESDVKQMNKRFFIHSSGLDILSRLLSRILDLEWDNCPMLLKHFERDSLRILYHLASTFEIRKLMVQHGCVEICTRSLLRVRKDQLDDIHPQSIASDAILVDVQAMAMGTLCNLCEVSETHCKIAETREVLERYLWAAHSEVFDPWFSQLAVSVFVCLAQSSQTHQFLTSEDIMERVIDTGRMRSELQHSKEGEIVLLKYFIGLYLSYLILVSPHLLPPSLYQRCEEHLSEFLSSATPRQVAQEESETGYLWAVLLPCVHLLYVPTPSLLQVDGLPEPRTLVSLQLLATEFALFFLQCLLSNTTISYVDGLLKERLLDYVVCLPAHMPTQRLRSQAQEVVQKLGNSVQLCTPSLATLAKAKLAKMKFGLEKVLQMRTVPQLFS